LELNLSWANWSTRNPTLSSSQALAFAIWSLRLTGWGMARPENNILYKKYYFENYYKCNTFWRGLYGNIILAGTRLVPVGHEAAISLHTRTRERLPCFSQHSC
jgi:hypothetical protein